MPLLELDEAGVIDDTKRVRLMEALLGVFFLCSFAFVIYLLLRLAQFWMARISTQRAENGKLQQDGVTRHASTASHASNVSANSSGTVSVDIDDGGEALVF